MISQAVEDGKLIADGVWQRRRWQSATSVRTSTASNSGRRAFTLLEVLIAITLSIFMVITVYSCFRVATATVTSCNRLSLENRLLAAGVVLALDDLDSWNDLDDAVDPLRQTLRTSPTLGMPAGSFPDGAQSARAQPFTAFAQSWTTGLAAVPTGSYDQGWLAHDPKTWYRGDGSLKTNGNGDTNERSIFGHYGLFGGTTPEVTLGPRSVDVVRGAIDAGSTLPVANWLNVQHKGLANGLGWYGWLDYVPANALIDFYEGADGSRARVLRELAGGDRNNLGAVGRLVNQGDPRVFSSKNRPVSRGSYLFGTHLGISRVLALNRTMGGNSGADAEALSSHHVLMKALDQPQALLPTQPEAWPTVETSIRRYMKYQRITNLCVVRLGDPLTTRSLEIVFPAVGTTLRGARLSRAGAAGGDLDG